MPMMFHMGDYPRAPTPWRLSGGGGSRLAWRVANSCSPPSPGLPTGSGSTAPQAQLSLDPLRSNPSMLLIWQWKGLERGLPVRVTARQWPLCLCHMGVQCTVQLPMQSAWPMWWQWRLWSKKQEGSTFWEDLATRFQSAREDFDCQRWGGTRLLTFRSSRLSWAVKWH